MDCDIKWVSVVEEDQTKTGIVYIFGRLQCVIPFLVVDVGPGGRFSSEVENQKYFHYPFVIRIKLINC